MLCLTHNNIGDYSDFVEIFGFKDAAARKYFL